MKETLARQISMLVVLVAISLGAFAALYYMAMAFTPPPELKVSPQQATFRPDDRDMPQSDEVLRYEGPDFNYPEPRRTKVTLARDEAEIVGKTQLTYRGRDGKGQLQLEVVLMDLDAETAYLNHIPVKQARQGILLGDEYFELISARRSKLVLWHVAP